MIAAAAAAGAEEATKPPLRGEPPMAPPPPAPTPERAAEEPPPPPPPIASGSAIAAVGASEEPIAEAALGAIGGDWGMANELGSGSAVVLFPINDAAPPMPKAAPIFPSTPMPP